MFDYAVVGGGIVGLSTAKTILQRDANSRLLLSKSAHGGRAGCGLYSPNVVEEKFSEVRSGLREVASCLWRKGL